MVPIKTFKNVMPKELMIPIETYPKSGIIYQPQQRIWHYMILKLKLKLILKPKNTNIGTKESNSLMTRFKTGRTNLNSNNYTIGKTEDPSYLSHAKQETFHACLLSLYCWASDTLKPSWTFNTQIFKTYQERKISNINKRNKCQWSRILSNKHENLSCSSMFYIKIYLFFWSKHIIYHPCLPPLLIVVTNLTTYMQI